MKILWMICLQYMVCRDVTQWFHTSPLESDGHSEWKGQKYLFCLFADNKTRVEICSQTMYMLHPGMLWCWGHCWGKIMVCTDSRWQKCARTLPMPSSSSLYSQPIEPSSRMWPRLTSRFQSGETIWPHRQRALDPTDNESCIEDSSLSLASS